ncbi:ankyrin repeat domain-containing protein 53-like [Saccostrea cucullata]|uniref:ankyrin repeat domain-containing protein 53-like n=1 Tax=Saccostrea cuccullata TaxID=36930 RepID=UPI002ED316AC
MSSGDKGQIGTESPRPLRKRRTRMANDKRIADDEFMAAAIGDVEWLRQSLREQKGKINFDKNGLSAVHLAAIHGRLDCLKLLIEKYKVNINLPSTTGWRPIHLCISNQTGKRALQCLQYLINKNADPSVPNNDGITPVHQAASEGHVQCLKLLIEIGAKIDGKDIRGHTPLDLAKLWGHKKCARILAAELWHQDKDNVAKELGQLKKLKMQQVLKEMEEQGEFKAAQEYYGEKAYQEWMQKKGLVQSPTEGNKEEGTKLDANQKGKTGESLMKPNSKVQQPSGKKSGSERSNIHVAFRDDRTPSPPSSRKQTDVSDDHGKEDTDKENQVSSARAKPKFHAFVNPESWRLALHPPKTEYITDLKDEYPRDEYTMMPRTKSAHKYFDGKFACVEDITERDLKNKKLKKDVRKPNLPREVIRQGLSKDPTLDQRPVLFKPIHMFDVTMKKKYGDTVKGKSEVSLHLCDDVSSIVYRNSLQRANTIDVVSPRSVTSDWLSARFPRDKVINTIKNMKNPTMFPNIRGEEYDINYGDIATFN